MGILSWFWGSQSPPPAVAEVKSEPVNVNLLDRLDGWSGGRTDSGVPVSEISALQMATVLACVNRIALDVATADLHIRVSNEDGSSTALDRMRVARMLRQRPNGIHTSFEFFVQMTAQQVLRGQALAYVLRNSAGEPIEIWPLQSREWSVQRVGYDLRYTISAYEGMISGRFKSRDVLHLRGMSMDGVGAIDRLFAARQSVGLAQAAQQTQSRAFRNGNRMPGFWSTDQPLSEVVMEKVRRSLQAQGVGENQWKSPLLDVGIKYHAAGATFEESQLIESRRHEMLEVCAAFNVLPAVLGIDDKTQAFASLEQMFSAHLRQTVRPVLKMWEQAIDRDLLDDLGPMYARFNSDEMDKATFKDRADAYRPLIDQLVLTPNEAREREGLPRVEGLDELWRQMAARKSGLEPEGGSVE